MTHEPDLTEPDELDALAADLARLRRQMDDMRIGFSVFVGALVTKLAHVPGFDGEKLLNVRTETFGQVKSERPGVARVLEMIAATIEETAEGKRNG